MSYEWPVDKMTLINSALAQTGNNLVNVADDGSDEWTVCSPAYERALAYVIEQHNWGFASVITALTASPTAPTNVQWDTAYPLPPDLAHLIWVRIADVAEDTTSQVSPSSTLYDIENVGGTVMLVINSKGGPPPPDDDTITPAEVTIKYISQTYSDPTLHTPTLVVALQSFVMSGIYRGLHDDLAEAKAMMQMGAVLLQDARSLYDRQKPKRSLFNSRIVAARRIRRPWPTTGNNDWGGTGIPG